MMRIRAYKGLLLAVGSICLAGTATAGLIVPIQPDSQIVPVGGNFTVDVVANGAVDLYAYQFDIGYDPTILAAVQVTEGPFLATGGATFFVPPTIDNIAGDISNTADLLLTAVSGVNGSGVLATITFTAIQPGTSAIDIFNTTFLDSSLSGITLSTVGGSVTVSDVTGVPEPATALFLSTALFGIIGLRSRRGRKK